MDVYLTQVTILVAMAAVGFVISAIVTRLAIHFAERVQWLAHPVERSSHSIPTPQVGGVGICLSWAVVLLVAEGTPSLSSLSGALLFVLLGGMALGLLDDRVALGAGAKMALLMVLAAVPVFTGHFIWVDFFHHFPWARGLGLLLSFLWILFFTNAFNFMDGVNGQAAVFAINFLFWMVPSFVLAWPCNLPAARFLAGGGGALLGFLVWNFPRARTFMGDSGSLPVGALMAVIAIDAGVAMLNLAWYAVPLIILSPFLYDVVYTLCRRLSRRENIFLAHRSHLYQRLLVATGWSHVRLLAFHLPIWVLAGVLGNCYMVFYQLLLVRLGAVAATALVLLAYTLYVHHRERLAEGAHQEVLP